MLLMDVEATSQQAQIYFEDADGALSSLSSDVESYRSEQGVSGWKVSLCGAAGAVTGAGLGALGK